MFLPFSIKKKKFYLATPGLSCGMQGLLGSACEFLVATCGIYFPHNELNSSPLIWEHRVLATGPSGKSLSHRHSNLESCGGYFIKILQKDLEGFKITF